MQDDLFGAPPAASNTPAPAPVKSPARQSLARVNAAPPDEALLAMARALPDQVRLGTSSWAYPGWAGLVWDTEYPESLLSREGLRAYGEHPLLRSVSVDRSFYRPLTQDQYARYAAQVPDDFRFVVKAPSHVTDVLVREAGALWCLCLHAKMPRLADQLPLLRMLWPGPMVCRWNLNPLHGAYGYEDAQREYEPYDRIHDIDHETRELLVRTIKGIAGAGQNVLVTISNKAEGCAPLSVRALAQGLAGAGPGPQRSATP